MINDDEFTDDGYLDRLPLLAKFVMGNPHMAADVMAAHSEIVRLRALITAWADACDRWGSEGLDITEQRIEETGRALRQAVGR